MVLMEFHTVNQGYGTEDSKLNELLINNIFELQIIHLYLTISFFNFLIDKSHSVSRPHISE